MNGFYFASVMLASPGEYIFANILLSRLLGIYSECSPLPLSTIVTFHPHVQLSLLCIIHYICVFMSDIRLCILYYNLDPSFCDNCDKYPNLVTGNPCQ